MSYNNYRQSTTRNVDNIRRDMREARENRETISFLEDMPLAMAYVPWQNWQNIYDAEKGFCRGTIFQELDLPFEGVGGCQK